MASPRSVLILLIVLSSTVACGSGDPPRGVPFVATIGTPAPVESAMRCSPAYPGLCVPPPPQRVSCAQLSAKNFKVLPPDPHGLDTDGDGIGCES